MERGNLVIAVSGKMQHGKDSIGNYLIAKYGFKALRFADKVKEICINYDNSTPKSRERWNKKIAREVLNNELRADEIDKLMQRVCPDVWRRGTHEDYYTIKPEWARLQMQGFAQGMRDLDSDCWVRYVLRKCVKEQGRWVITDLRYKNEAFAIDVSEDAQIWRVVRPIPPSTGANHVSECDLDSYPFEIFINNDGTIEELYKRVDKIIKKLLQGNRPLTSNGEDVY
jgi:dephospho-CoA kinase